MFYTYRQNNSGGYYIGPSYVIVEADSSSEADFIAEQNGIYFNGVMRGRDCECCGDRWYNAWDDDATDEPMVYREPAIESENCVIVYKNKN